MCPRLQSPIIDRAGTVVTFVQVLLGQLQVNLDHLHRAVAEESLKNIAIAGIAQELNGEGVPEAVGMGARHTGPGAEAADQAAQRVAADRCPILGEEKTVVVAPGRGLVAEVAPDGLGGARTEGNDTLQIILAIQC